jgi:hypothetical protein
MSRMGSALLLGVCLCVAGSAGAQIEWVPYEDNPIWPPAEPGTWYAEGRWVGSMILVDGTYHLFLVGSTAPGPSMMPVSYRFLWLPRGEDNSTPTASDTFTLDVGASVRYENVLSELFGASPNALGALALSSDGGNVLVMSRTYNIPT